MGIDSSKNYGNLCRICPWILAHTPCKRGAYMQVHDWKENSGRGARMTNFALTRSAVNRRLIFLLGSVLASIGSHVMSMYCVKSNQKRNHFNPVAS